MRRDQVAEPRPAQRHDRLAAGRLGQPAVHRDDRLDRRARGGHVPVEGQAEPPEQTPPARAQLESTVQHLAFPIIPVIEGILVLPLIGTLDLARLAEAGMRFYEAILREQASVAIIDITGVPAMDPNIARELLRITRATTLLGCQPMLVGITPAAAEELVHLGFRTDNLPTQSTLQQAVALALRMRAPQQHAR